MTATAEYEKAKQAPPTRRAPLLIECDDYPGDGLIVQNNPVDGSFLVIAYESAVGYDSSVTSSLSAADARRLADWLLSSAAQS